MNPKHDPLAPLRAHPGDICINDRSPTSQRPKRAGILACVQRRFGSKSPASGNSPVAPEAAHAASGSNSPTLVSTRGWVSRWLTVGSALALLLGVHLAQAAEVVFDDGLEHTINNATHRNDSIRVRNGTRLVINPGTVLGGTVFDMGFVECLDTSSVTINGGTFGGSAKWTGWILAWGTSTVTINGGTFGGSGLESGIIQAANNATVTINGGAFGGPKNHAGSVQVFDTATVTVTEGIFGGGGEHSGAIFANDTSTLRILRGSFGGSGHRSGLVWGEETSNVTIDGGTFGGKGTNSGLMYFPGNADLTINGGTFGGDGENSGTFYVVGALTINGGTFGGLGAFTGSIHCLSSSRVAINGGAFGGPGTQANEIHIRDTATLTVSGGAFGEPAKGFGGFLVFNSARVEFQAGSFDTTSFLPTSGGTLGVTFVEQSPQSVAVKLTGGAVQLQVVVPAPDLRMVATAASLKLSWSQSAVGYRLQSTGGLGNASEWTVWPEAPVAEGDLWVVHLPPSTAASGTQFFRLHRDLRRTHSRLRWPLFYGNLVNDPEGTTWRVRGWRWLKPSGPPTEFFTLVADLCLRKRTG